jgi:hypothetical protein
MELTDFLEAFAMPQSITLPLSALYGKVSRALGWCRLRPIRYAATSTYSTLDPGVRLEIRIITYAKTRQAIDFAAIGSVTVSRILDSIYSAPLNAPFQRPSI